MKACSSGASVSVRGGGESREVHVEEWRDDLDDASSLRGERGKPEKARWHVGGEDLAAGLNGGFELALLLAGLGVVWDSGLRGRRRSTMRGGFGLGARRAAAR